MNEALDRARASRWAWAEIDPAAIAHNVVLVRAHVAPSDVWAVVKANGYGHGAITAARAALDGGAAGLAVALVQEGVELRDAGLVEVPILVLSPQPPEQLSLLVEHDLTPTVHDAAGIDALASVVGGAGRRGFAVHLKIDTGMGRVGARPVDAVDLAARIAGEPALRFAGCFTHLAVADEPDDPYTAAQLARFDAVLDDLAARGLMPEHLHGANSAGALAHPAARRGFVRAGIAIYGIEPGGGVASWMAGFRPALRLVARVSHVKPMAAGERISYGLRHRFSHDTTVATVPIGYADGVPRRLSANGGEVLIGGRRCPIVGVVTMDQLMVDCRGVSVAVGDEVVLLGDQGDERIRPEDWADRLGTIAYEIVCGLSGRIERRTQPR